MYVFTMWWPFGMPRDFSRCNNTGSSFIVEVYAFHMKKLTDYMIYSSQQTATVL